MTSPLPVSSLPPRARKIPRDVTVHGDVRVDDYYWLRNSKNPAVINYLKAENEHTEAVMKSLGGLPDVLSREMAGRIQGDAVRGEYTKDGFVHYFRMKAGLEYEIHCRRPARPGGVEEVLLDVNEMAKGHDYAELGSLDLSRDNRVMLYTFDWTGSGNYEPFLMDMATRRVIRHEIGLVSDIAWGGSDALYYVTCNRVNRPDRIWRWTLSTGTKEMLYHEENSAYSLSVDDSLDDHYVFCTSVSNNATEVRVLDLTVPGSQFVVLQPRRKGHEYGVEHCRGTFYFHTNHQAPNGRVMTAPAATPGIDHWSEVVPEDPTMELGDVLLFDRHLVLQGNRSGLTVLQVFDLDARHLRTVDFDSVGCDIEMEAPLDASSPEFFFDAESFVQPCTSYAINLTTLARRVAAVVHVPNFNPADYRMERIWVPARDGVQVPVSLVYSRHLDRSRPQPLNLCGYGSYGNSTPPDFARERISLLDRGMIYAVAHVRGGGDLGPQWKEAGRMGTKTTTFNDFIDCAEWLVANGWADRERLTAEGTSAGGLLVTAAANLRPGLFRAVVASVPFVDVLNTMLDDTIPLTIDEYDEWGNPHIKEQYDWMRTYSPYDNLVQGAHPDTLVNISLNDGNVPYWEGAKYLAKLRDLETGGARHLLYVNMAAGHGGATGRYHYSLDIARNYAFILQAVGLGLPQVADEPARMAASIKVESQANGLSPTPEKWENAAFTATQPNSLLTAIGETSL